MFKLEDGYCPMPLNGMSIVAALGSLEVIRNIELFDPVDVGLKATLTVKFLPGLIVLLPRPLLIKNMDSFVPVIDEDIERSAVPLFLFLKEAILLLPNFTLPKS